jgi:hypothetical protein
MVYVVQSYWACFGLLSIVLYVEDKKYHNVSETGSVSVLRWMGQDKPNQLGPLERAGLNHWSRCGIFCLPHTRRWIKSKKKPNSSVQTVILPAVFMAVKPWFSY